MNGEVVSLESFITPTLPVKLPEIRRKGVVRLRGFVEAHESDPRKRVFVDERKALYFHPPLAIPIVGIPIETIATEGACQYFVKFWKPIPVTQYDLRSDTILEDLVLSILASQPDERLTSDDLHNEEFDKVLKERGRDPRVRGAILAGLISKGVLRVVGENVRSTRSTCHNRPGLRQFTWKQLTQ